MPFGMQIDSSLNVNSLAQVAYSRSSPFHHVSPMMYSRSSPFHHVSLFSRVFLVLFGVFGVLVGLVVFLVLVSEYAEFQPLARMTCAHRTHGVSTRAKKNPVSESLEQSGTFRGSFPRCLLNAMVVIAFRCAIRPLTKLPQQREQLCTFRANSLTAKPTGGHLPSAQEKVRKCARALPAQANSRTLNFRNIY